MSKIVYPQFKSIVFTCFIASIILGPACVFFVLFNLNLINWILIFFVALLSIYLLRVFKRISECIEKFPDDKFGNFSEAENVEIARIYRISYLIVGVAYFVSVIWSVYLLRAQNIGELKAFFVTIFLSLIIFFQTAGIFNHSYVFKNENDVL